MRTSLAKRLWQCVALPATHTHSQRMIQTNVFYHSLPETLLNVMRNWRADARERARVGLNSQLALAHFTRQRRQ
jgi:hypothetical protein